MENHQGIVILCSPSLVNWMHKTFAELFADQRLPASIAWSGHSCRYGQGVVMVTWKGEVSEHFLGQLEIDTDVIDYVLYNVSVAS
jgi:hypothetical protein